MTLVAQDLAERPTWQALKRGFLGHCPQCGRGHIFSSYLKVRECCEVCREELHHHRADDAPPYFTILIVAHILAFTMVGAMTAWDDIPYWVDLTVWPAMVVMLSLVLLPRIKGALIALQWAQRMHGFGQPTPLGANKPSPFDQAEGPAPQAGQP